MAESVRIGVVGTSWWADGFHLPSLASHPRAQLTAICGRTRERAEEMASKYTIPAVFTDYHAMIASGTLDAVVVVTPDALHYPITMGALEAGLHVLCEKALALTAVQAKAMYDTAEAARRSHLVMFTWRWVPPFQHLRHLIEHGYIGRCYHAHFRFQGGYGRAASYGWRFDRTYGHGILGDLGSHLIDLARWYVGDIARVSGQLATFVERPGRNGQPLDAANDAASVAVEFVDGAQGLIHVSAVAHVGERDLDIRVALYGDAGSLELDFTPGAWELRGVHDGEEQWRVQEVPQDLWGEGAHAPPFDEPSFAPFVTLPVGDRLFIDGIVEDHPVAPSFYDGWKAQQVVDAAIASHEQGRWIAIA